MHAAFNDFVWLYFPHTITGNSAISAIQEAMDRYTEQTCITFEARSDEEDYVRFYSGNGYVCQYLLYSMTPFIIYLHAVEIL